MATSCKSLAKGDGAFEALVISPLLMEKSKLSKQMTVPGDQTMSLLLLAMPSLDDLLAKRASPVPGMHTNCQCFVPRSNK
jgi:hypothetical protein